MGNKIYHCDQLTTAEGFLQRGGLLFNFFYTPYLPEKLKCYGTSVFDIRLVQYCVFKIFKELTITIHHEVEWKSILRDIGRGKSTYLPVHSNFFQEPFDFTRWKGCFQKFYYTFST